MRPTDLTRTVGQRAIADGLVLLALVVWWWSSRDLTASVLPSPQAVLARLVAIARRQDDAVALCVDLEDRPDRRVDLGIHQHDVLPVFERLEDHGRRIFDVPRDLANDIHLLAAAEEEWVVGIHGPAGSDRVLEGRLLGMARALDGRTPPLPRGRTMALPCPDPA